MSVIFKNTAHWCDSWGNTTTRRHSYTLMFLYRRAPRAAPVFGLYHFIWDAQNRDCDIRRNLSIFSSLLVSRKKNICGIISLIFQVWTVSFCKRNPSVEEQSNTINCQHSLLSLVTVNSRKRKGEKKQKTQLHLKIKPAYSIAQPFCCAMCVCVCLHFFSCGGNLWLECVSLSVPLQNCCRRSQSC